MSDDETDDMCPNCQTPWKCNGPHDASETPRSLRGRRPFSEIKSARIERTQDRNDGAAMRLLREALAAAFEWGMDVTIGKDDAGVTIWCAADDDLPDLTPSPLWHHEGATIAEAADKCRETLEQGDR